MNKLTNQGISISSGAMVASSIDSVGHETRSFPPPPELSCNALVPNLATYQKMYERSLKDPEGFWGEIAQEFFWYKKWDRDYVP